MNAHEFVEDLPPVFTIRSFGNVFGFSPKTVYRMIDNKEIGCLRRPNDTIRILRTHVEDWINACDSQKYPDAANSTLSGQKTGERSLDLQAAKLSAMLNES